MRHTVKRIVVQIVCSIAASIAADANACVIIPRPPEINKVNPKVVAELHFGKVLQVRNYLVEERPGRTLSVNITESLQGRLQGKVDVEVVHIPDCGWFGTFNPGDDVLVLRFRDMKSGLLA